METTGEGLTVRQAAFIGVGAMVGAGIVSATVVAVVAEGAPVQAHRLAAPISSPVTRAAGVTS